MDLGQLVADERWDALDDYIKGLPSNTRLNEAMVNDPEYAEYIASQEEPTEKWTPRVSEWNLGHIMQRQLISAVAGVQAAIVASNGGTPSRAESFPSPATEVDRAKTRLEYNANAALLRMAGFDPSEYL